MLKTIIIDDEAKARKVIAGIIEKKCPYVNIIAQADSVETGLKAILNYKPDLVLLDIKLGDGMGFDLLDNLNNINFKIIFLTAYNEFAVKAIRVSALDYILKPINAEELVAAIERASEEVKKDDINIRLETMLSNIKKDEKQIVLKSANAFYVKNIKEIIRCEADGNYTNFYFADGKQLVISKSLHEFEEMLSEYGFFRVHNAHLINLTFIERFERNKGGCLYLKDNTNIPIARSKKQELINTLSNISL